MLIILLEGQYPGEVRSGGGARRNINVLDLRDLDGRAHAIPANQSHLWLWFLSLDLEL